MPITYSVEIQNFKLQPQFTDVRKCDTNCSKMIHQILTFHTISLNTNRTNQYLNNKQAFPFNNLRIIIFFGKNQRPLHKRSPNSSAKETHGLHPEISIVQFRRPDFLIPQ